MAECERLTGCPFFLSIKQLPKTAEQMVTSYCRGDNSNCARLWCISAGVRPPDDLFPNERDRALKILTHSKKSPATVSDSAQPKKASHKP